MFEFGISFKSKHFHMFIIRAYASNNMKKNFIYFREDYAMMELGAPDPITQKGCFLIYVPEENLAQYIQDLENEVKNNTIRKKLFLFLKKEFTLQKYPPPPLPKVKKDYSQNKIKEETSKKNCKKEKTA